jgi:hypothetical protein
LDTGGSSSIRRAAALAAALGALPGLCALYAWAVRFMLRRNLEQLRAGDAGPLFGTYAEDVKLVLHGRHSWSGHHRGRDEVERWMRRFLRVGVHLEPGEIFVTGPPWNTTICMRFTDWLAAPDGRIVYANRGTIFGKIAWGRLTYHEVNEDTQQVADLDKYLALREPGGHEESTMVSGQS